MHVAVPLLAVLFVALRRLLPVTAYGVGGTRPGHLAGAPPRRLGPRPGAGRSRRLVGRPPRLAAAGRRPLRGRRRPRPVGARERSAPCRRTCPAPARPAGRGAADPGNARRSTSRSALPSLLALGVIALRGPRAWALGAAVLAALGVLGLGAAAGCTHPGTCSPGWPPTAARRLDLTLVGVGHRDRRRGPTGWWAVSVAATLVLLLRQVRDQDRVLATSCVGSWHPRCWRSALWTSVLRLEPPLWGGVLAGALATGVAARCCLVGARRSRGGWAGAATTAYLAVVTLALAAANDLLLAVAALRARPSACWSCTSCARRREAPCRPPSPAAPGRAPRRLGRSWPGALSWARTTTRVAVALAAVRRAGRRPRRADHPSAAPRASPSRSRHSLVGGRRRRLPGRRADERRWR